MLKKRLTTILSMSILIPGIVNASTCTNFVNQINHDITRYSQAIKNQHLPWMNLSTLQQKLGHGAPSKNSDGLSQYKWTCPESANAYLLVTVVNGKIIKVDGEYDDHANGEGLFTADLSVETKASSAPPQPALSQSTSPLVNTKTSLSSAAPVQQPVLSQPASTPADTEANPSSPAPQQQPFPPPANPTNVCDDTIMQINADFRTHAAARAAAERQNKKIPLPSYVWMNVAWLKERLGQPEIKILSINLYEWDDYTVYGGDDGKIAVGEKPAGITSDEPTLADLTRVLGTPITNMSESLNEYTWNCPMKSTLNIKADKQDGITSVSGEYCKNDNKCSLFIFPGPVKTELQVKFSQIMSLPAKQYRHN